MCVPTPRHSIVSPLHHLTTPRMVCQRLPFIPDVMCDMMCGIGPFAVPAAVQGIHSALNRSTTQPLRSPSPPNTRTYTQSHTHSHTHARATLAFSFDLILQNRCCVFDICTQGMRVYANDKNPRSYHYLTLNAKRNKVWGVLTGV